MAKDETIPVNISRHLKKVLPKTAYPSTLIIGERHDEAEHIQWLNDHLDELHKRHQINTIGIETAAFQNVFLWAYRDGTLTDLLGSKKAAEHYLHAA